MNDNKSITIQSYDKSVDAYIKKVDNLHPVKEGDYFLSLLNKNALILDLGCGPGRDAKIFTQKGFNVIGVDLSKKMIVAAKKRTKLAQFKIMDMLKLEFKANYFDGVWASASFIHISKKDMLKGLKEVFRVLKTNGVFYISMKEGKGEVIKPDKRYGELEKFWSFYQKEEIENELKKVRFKILKSYIEEQEGKYATNPWIQIFCRK